MRHNPENKLPPDQLVCKSGEYFSPIDLKLSIYGFFKETMSTLINFAKIPQSEVISKVYENLPIADQTATKDISGADVNRAVVEAKESYLQTRGQKIQTPTSPEFKRWFAGSVIVDESGDPLVVYHGTKKGGFTEFDLGKSNWGEFAFFTDSIKTAKTHSSKSDSQIYQVYLRILDPLIIDANGMRWMEIKYNGQLNNTQKICEYAKSIGKDGAIFLNVLDEGEFSEGNEIPSTVFVAFNNNQIKSAVNNTEYSMNTANIFKNPYEWSADYEAMGQVPYHASMNYHGAVIWLAPQLFLSLCNDLPEESRRTRTVDYAAQQWQLGGKVAPPQLYIAPKGKGWRVRGHEGRHRTTIAMQNGATEIPVLVHIYDEYGMIKGDRITPKLVESLRGPMLSEEYAKGKRNKQFDFRKYWINGTLYEDGVAMPVSKESALSKNSKSIKKNFGFLANLANNLDPDYGKTEVLRPPPERRKDYISIFKQKRILNFPQQVAWARDNTTEEERAGQSPEDFVRRLRHGVTKYNDADFEEMQRQEEIFGKDAGIYFKLPTDWTPEMGKPNWSYANEKLPEGWQIKSVITQNPPSPDFDYLASGSAAAAYRNQKLVEIITKSKNKRYDISRDVVIEARERLPANLKKYLPIINRKRIDKNKGGRLEFIYEMPFYNKVTQGPEEPSKYTNYSKYGYDYPTEPELRKIESVLNEVMLEAYAKAGVPYKRENAKFDGSYMNQDSLVCNPIFNMGWYQEGNKKIMVFRDPLFAWMPTEGVLMLYGDKFPENRAKTITAEFMAELLLSKIKGQSTNLARYLKASMQ